MSKRWNVFLLALLTLSALAGCASRAQVAENRSNSAAAAGEGSPVRPATVGQLDEERRLDIGELVYAATMGRSLGQRSAAVLAAADRSTADLADLINAIDAARAVVLSNVRGADVTGFKATRCSVDGRHAVFRLDFTQGAMLQTTNALDLAIQGNGFFLIKIMSNFGDGIAYAREGNFYLNKENELMLGLGEGYRLVPPVTIPAGSTDIQIGQDGTIQATPPGSATPRTVGQLQLARFVSPEGMQLLNSSIFLATDESGLPMTGTPGTKGLGMIQQGYLEASNVDLVRERLRLRFLNEWQSAIEQALAAGDPPKPNQPGR
jgi:flagellar basal body rod protein FlgG